MVSDSEEDYETWYAFYSESDEREFYFEPKTNQTTWVLPANVDRVQPFDLDEDFERLSLASRSLARQESLMRDEGVADRAPSSDESEAAIIEDDPSASSEKLDELDDVSSHHSAVVILNTEPSRNIYRVSFAMIVVLFLSQLGGLALVGMPRQPVPEPVTPPPLRRGPRLLKKVRSALLFPHRVIRNGLEYICKLNEAPPMPVRSREDTAKELKLCRLPFAHVVAEDCSQVRRSFDTLQFVHEML